MADINNRADPFTFHLFEPLLFEQEALRKAFAEGPDAVHRWKAAAIAATADFDAKR